uniref:VWFA domain-containing protein n=1 Tax=Panagrellus redivivus TaxID=6233 RepID=A0A7E4VAC4_PANRE
MNLRLVIAVLCVATAAFAQNWDCSVQTTAWYSRCQVDLTVAIDMSSAMGDIQNVDALVQSVQNLLTYYVYGSNTVASVITFGAGGIDSSNFVNDYTSLCQLVKSEQNQSHANGLYTANLRTVLQTYQISQPANAREYQRVLVLLSAIDDETQVYDALPVAQSLQNDNNVQIIPVSVGRYNNPDNAYLSLLGNQSFASSSYDLGWNLLDSIANASCVNSGITYPPETVAPPTPTLPASPYFNGSDGLICAANPKNAWLDLVFVIEHSSVTFSQWNAITSNIISTLTKLTLSNTLTSGHTSRIAIITYDASGTTKLQYEFTAEQTLRSIAVALNRAKPLPTLGEKADIASGLNAASDYLNTHSSFRAPGVVLYAASYDDSGTNDPQIAAEGLKADLTKIVTVSYDAANGVSTPKIDALSSPGLHLSSQSSLAQFGWAVSQLNCRCAHGWTQLIVGEVSYADCFFYQTTTSLQAFAQCNNLNTDILALASTPARLDSITNLISKEKPTNEVSIGLLRNDGTSQWTWQNVYAYFGYPAFSQGYTTTDTYGYLSKTGNNTWQLLADDGLTGNGRFFVCQQRSGDTDNIIDLKAQ